MRGGGKKKKSTLGVIWAAQQKGGGAEGRKEEGGGACNSSYHFRAKSLLSTGKRTHKHTRTESSLSAGGPLGEESTEFYLSSVKLNAR